MKLGGTAKVTLYITETKVSSVSDRLEIMIFCRVKGENIPFIGTKEKNFTLLASAGGVELVNKDIRLANVSVPEYRVLGFNVSPEVESMFEHLTIMELSDTERAEIPRFCKPKGFLK